MDETKGAALGQSTSREDVLRRVQTAESVFLPREVFEALYLNPERNVAGDLRKKVRQNFPLRTLRSITQLLLVWLK
jgi:hypothetical protein